MPQRKKPLAPTDKDLNAHEKLFAERVARKVLTMVDDEWIAAGGAGSIRPQAVAEALRIALASAERES
ncbi:MAG TPA: hypothetical protein VK797_30090 [Tepidisphaeraceae bacterium]|nr:hypothetical protein [Tepidisphaeraceae bacterium]